MPKANQSEFKSRYEIKYLVKLSQLKSLSQLLAERFVQDENSEGGDGSYAISSLYFDSPGLVCYRQKIDGEEVRHKFRIRLYGKNLNLLDPEQASKTKVFFEVKSRINQCIAKLRIQMNFSHLQAMMLGEESSERIAEIVMKNCPVEQKTTAEKICDLLEKHFLSGSYERKVVTAYERSAWNSVEGDGTRITVDKNLYGILPDIFFKSQNQKKSAGFEIGKKLIPSVFCILELKFNDTLPLVVFETMSNKGFMPQRFSKYANALEGLSKEIFKAD